MTGRRTGQGTRTVDSFDRNLVTSLAGQTPIVRSLRCRFHINGDYENRR